MGRPPRKVPDGTRWCGGCQAPLPIERFTGVERSCRECKYRRHVARKYGLTVAEYDSLLAKQGPLCAVCNVRPHRYVDHCHVTGVVRGLLCPTCNTAVGYMELHPLLASQASTYLTRTAEMITNGGADD
jgi:hypothetical protein